MVLMRVRPALSVTPLCPSEHQAAADRGDWHLQGTSQPSKVKKKVILNFFIDLFRFIRLF